MREMRIRWRKDRQKLRNKSTSSYSVPKVGLAQAIVQTDKENLPPVAEDPEQLFEEL
jgi:hypothetical protein